MKFPAPHGDKLRALLGNHKLPADDRPGVHTAIERYEAWIEELRRIAGTGSNLVEPMVDALNRYKLSIDLDLIFDSKNDFLYRQKGQLTRISHQGSIDLKFLSPADSSIFRTV